jgi:hypothetical protein
MRQAPGKDFEAICMSLKGSQVSGIDAESATNNQNKSFCLKRTTQHYGG